MEGYISIKRADLVEVMWGICLSDHLGDVWVASNLWWNLWEYPRTFVVMNF